jgi:hypothetical protein
VNRSSFFAECEATIKNDDPSLGADPDLQKKDGQASVWPLIKVFFKASYRCFSLRSTRSCYPIPCITLPAEL